MAQLHPKVEWNMGENNKEKEKKSYSKGTIWFSLRRSMQCKSEPSEVHSPSSKNNRKHHHLNAILMTTIRGKEGGTRSGCSRSISNLRDVVIHGSKRHLPEKGGGAVISCSPRSIGSNELLNPITHELVLRNNSKCEIRITSFGGFQDGSFLGTLRPGTPGPGGAHSLNSSSPPPPLIPRRGRRATHSGLGDNSKENGFGFSSKGKAAADVNASSSSSSSSVTCHRCGEEFGMWEALEVHHLFHHAVTELMEGDSSRKIVEIICRSSWLKPESRPPGCRGGGRMIDRVLKVHNTQKTLACFEEYREMVKAKAGKLHKKHPRCLADGNELLRFHGTTVSCPLGTGGSHGLCTSQRCRVCHLIRNGFSMEKDPKCGIGVFTTSTSGRALESIELQRAARGHDDDDGEHPLPRKALVVCRVIAGRVHRPLENVQEMAGQTGFDSLAGKVGLYSNIEELYLLNPRALLPCFVVICKS